MADQPPKSTSQASKGGPVKSPSTEQGGEWEKAGRVIGRFAGRAGSFLGKASEVFKEQYETAQQREGDSVFQKIWDQTRECVKKGTDKENVARLKELALLAKENTSELSGGAAERIARIYTDCSGQPATAAEVKQVALRFGVMALVTFVTASVLGRAGLAKNLFSQVGDVASEFGSEGGVADFNGDLEERTAQFYAHEVIDAEAVVIDVE